MHFIPFHFLILLGWYIVISYWITLSRCSYIVSSQQLSCPVTYVCLFVCSLKGKWLKLSASDGKHISLVHGLTLRSKCEISQGHTKKNWPLGGAMARVVPNISLAVCPPQMSPYMLDFGAGTAVQGIRYHPMWIRMSIWLPVLGCVTCMQCIDRCGLLLCPGPRWESFYSVPQTP